MREVQPKPSPISEKHSLRDEQKKYYHAFQDRNWTLRSWHTKIGFFQQVGILRAVMPSNISANKTGKYPTVYRRTRIVEQNDYRTRYVSQQRSLDKMNTFTSKYIRPSGEKGEGRFIVS